MPVSLGHHGLLVGDQEVPIYSGTMHYWRHDPTTWEHLLRRVLDLGFRMIETYVPWSVHEITPGMFDFGTHDARNNLPAFLDLCHRLGITVCIRPGPHINAELTWFGFPKRLLADPSVWSITATGAPAITDRVPQPFPVPSYASETLFAETARFFDALCPLLVERLAPAGPIVACQVDNETCYFFRHNVYDLDYSPDSLALYRRFLQERYEAIAVLNDVYGTNYEAFADVSPPRDWEAQERRDLPRHLDWVAYREYYITSALNRIGGMLRERGINVPLYHDIAFQSSTPIDTADLQAQPHIDFLGTNLYANQEEYDTIAHRVRYQAGSQHVPFVPELGAGVWWSHYRVFTPAEQEFLVLAALMHGIKAANFYMLVERDRWVGSPITRDGLLRPGYADFFQRLSALIKETDLLRTEKRRSVLVLYNYDLGRFQAAYSTLHPAYLGFAGVSHGLSTVETDLGFAHDPAVVGDRTQPESWLRQVMDTLERAQIEYDLSDTHAPLEILSRYALVLVPMADFCDQAAQQRLLAYAKGGGHLVFGPGVPNLDTHMRPAAILAGAYDGLGDVFLGAGIVTLLRNTSTLPSLLAPEYTNSITHDVPDLRLTIREGPTTLCFLANPTDRPHTARLQSPYRLRGLWNAKPEDDGMEPITIEPYTVQIWEVLR